MIQHCTFTPVAGKAPSSYRYVLQSHPCIKPKRSGLGDSGKSRQGAFNYLLWDELADETQLPCGNLPVTSLGVGLAKMHELSEHLVHHVCWHRLLALTHAVARADVV